MPWGRGGGLNIILFSSVKEYHDDTKDNNGRAHLEDLAIWKIVRDSGKQSIST